MEFITGVDMSKKSLPKTLAKEIEQKKKQRTKENGSMHVFWISKQAFYKRLRTQQKKEIDYQKMIKMVKEYRKKVGSKTGGIKRCDVLKQDFVNADIKIGRDKFYRF